MIIIIVIANIIIIHLVSCKPCYRRHEPVPAIHPKWPCRPFVVAERDVSLQRETKRLGRICVIHWDRRRHLCVWRQEQEEAADERETRASANDQKVTMASVQRPSTRVCPSAIVKIYLRFLTCTPRRGESINPSIHPTTTNILSRPRLFEKGIVLFHTTTTHQ